MPAVPAGCHFATLPLHAGAKIGFLCPCSLVLRVKLVLQVLGTIIRSVGDVHSGYISKAASRLEGLAIHLCRSLINRILELQVCWTFCSGRAEAEADAI